MLPDLRIGDIKGQGIAIYPPGATYGPRQMRDHEFVWLIEGDAVYQRDGVPHVAPRGSVVLCQPGAVDGFTWDPTRRTRHGFFHFDLHRVPRDWAKPPDWPIVRVPEHGDLLRPLCQHVLTAIGKIPREQMRLTIAHILSLFISGHYSTLEAPHDALPDAVERALAHMHRALETRPNQTISLAQLAEVACVTPEHLCRLFKSSIGSSPVQTVLMARLDQGAVLLARSNYSIREIAKLCGFASEFHFSRRFKLAFKRSPTEMRRLMRSGLTPPIPLMLRWQGR